MPVVGEGGRGGAVDAARVARMRGPVAVGGVGLQPGRRGAGRVMVGVRESGGEGRGPFLGVGWVDLSDHGVRGRLIVWVSWVQLARGVGDGWSFDLVRAADRIWSNAQG